MSTKLSVVCPAFSYFPVVAPAMMAQRDPNWELVIVHDGPNPMYDEWIRGFRDSRIHLICSAYRMGLWGHPLRDTCIRNASGEYVCVTNADNYYTPNFVGEVLKTIHGHDGCHVDMLHSHHGWLHLVAHLEYCKIDTGAFIVRTEIAKAVGWPSYEKDSDWDYIQRCMKITKDIVRVPYTCLIHN